MSNELLIRIQCNDRNQPKDMMLFVDGDGLSMLLERLGIDASGYSPKYDADAYKVDADQLYKVLGSLYRNNRTAQPKGEITDAQRAARSANARLATLGAIDAAKRRKAEREKRRNGR